MTAPQPKGKNRGLELFRQQASGRSVLSVQIVIAELRASGRRVTLAGIVATSKSLAEAGFPGVMPVSHMTILRNEGCRKLFDEARPEGRKRGHMRVAGISATERQLASRLMRMPKEGLVKRILELEAKVEVLEAQTARLRSALLEKSLDLGGVSAQKQ